jgi:hypothetical protein
MRDWESMMADVGWWWNGRRVIDAIRRQPPPSLKRTGVRLPLVELAVGRVRGWPYIVVPCESA